MPCPNDTTLQRFVNAELEDDEEKVLEDHLAVCDACQQRLEKLEQIKESPLTPLSCEYDFGTETELEQELDHILATEKTQELPEMLPEMIGQYKIKGLLGRGGMGTVYCCKHPFLKRLAAIKVIRSSRTFLPTAIARFYREMEAIGKLHHPNIVQAFDAGEVNGQSYIVMELLEGIDLSNYVKQHGTMEISEALSVVRQTALGLQHAHNTGLIHRDIKPSNLWLLPDKTVKVLDLGLARLLESDHSESVTGQIVGSRGYISPEQAQGTTVDQRSDIYSLGCTFYFLLTGQTPPENGDFVLPVAVLEKMIAFDPQNRFQSMSEVIAALDHLERKPNRFYRIILFLLLTATALSAGILLRFIFDARRTETPESETSDMVVPTVVQTIDQKNDQKNDQIIDPKNSADGNWLTTKEIADYLSVSDATIYRWIEQKGLPAHRAGRGWRFNKNEVNLWLKNQNKEKNAP